MSHNQNTQVSHATLKKSTRITKTVTIIWEQVESKICSHLLEGFMSNEESPLKCKECRFWRSDNRGINSTLKFDILSALEGLQAQLLTWIYTKPGFNKSLADLGFLLKNTISYFHLRFWIIWFISITLIFNWCHVMFLIFFKITRACRFTTRDTSS